MIPLEAIIGTPGSWSSIATSIGIVPRPATPSCTTASGRPSASPRAMSGISSTCPRYSSDDDGCEARAPARLDDLRRELAAVDLAVEDEREVRVTGLAQLLDDPVRLAQVGGTDAHEAAAVGRVVALRARRAGARAGRVRLVRPSPGETWSRPASFVIGSETAVAP